MTLAARPGAQRLQKARYDFWHQGSFRVRLSKGCDPGMGGDYIRIGGYPCGGWVPAGALNPWSRDTFFHLALLLTLTPGVIWQVYQVITYEGWSDIQYGVQDGSGPYVWVYFLGIIVLGPIFALNLFLVVLSKTYGAAKLRENLEKHHLKLMEETRQHLAEFAEEKEQQKKALAETLAAEEAGGANGQETCTVTELARDDNSQVKDSENVRVSGAAFGDPGHAANSNGQAASAINSSEAQHLQFQMTEESTTSSEVPHLKRQMTETSHKHHRRKSLMKRQQLRLRELALSEELQDVVVLMIVLNTLFMASDAHVNVCEDKQASFISAFSFQQDYFYRSADEKSNTPVNVHNVRYKTVVEASNIFFAFVFVLELLIKFFGLGFKKFFFNGISSFWNLFDLVVVILSVSEVLCSLLCALLVEQSERKHRVGPEKSKLEQVPSVLQNTNCFASANTCFEVEQCGAGMGIAVRKHTLTHAPCSPAMLHAGHACRCGGLHTCTQAGGVILKHSRPGHRCCVLLA